jgi:hypothetical protein
MPYPKTTLIISVYKDTDIELICKTALEWEKSTKV